MQGPPRPFDAAAGNIGQLVFVRVGNDIAIADDEDAVMTELHHIRHDDKRTADRIDVIPRPNELQSRPATMPAASPAATKAAPKYKG